MNVERLATGRDFVDPDGDVRFMADWLPEMEDIDRNPAPHAVVGAGIKRVKRKRSGQEPLFGRDAARLIDEATAQAEAASGRPLTEEEMLQIANDVTWQNRHSE